MKKYILALFMLPFFANAQEVIFVEGKSGNLFINHIAAPKESFYSIGRLYNISPKEIAPYNKMDLEKGVSIGQALKIPLKQVNFIQTNKVETDEVAVPLYHKVEASETLSQLSNNYNKVAPSVLKAWNGLKSDALSSGQNIIIGYLKVKKGLSAFAKQTSKIPDENATSAVVKESSVKKIEPAIVKATTKPKKEFVIKKTEAPADEIKKQKIEKAIENNAAVPENKINKKDSKIDYFKSNYLNSGKQETGTAAVFKSTSGWEDGKYYCLHNSASQGAIVKITNPANGKFIYAKVLDAMPELKQNENLAVRISNSAADALGATTSSFECEINY